MEEKEVIHEETKKGGARLQKKDTHKQRMAAFIAILAVVILYGSVCTAARISTKVFPGVSVLGENLGGMHRVQAENTLRSSKSWQDDDGGVTFTAEEDSTFVSFDSLGMTLDVSGSAENAYAYGRSEGVLVGGWRYLCGLLGKKTTVAPAWEYNNAITGVAAHKIADYLSVEAIAAKEEACADGLHLTKQRDERTVRASEVLDVITDPTLCGREKSGTVELSYQTREMEPLDLTAVAEKYSHEAVSAGYDAETQSITPEQIHVDFDVSQTQKQLEEAAAGQTITVGTATLPKVSAEELKEVLFRDELSSYTTKVGGAEGRHKNVQNTAAKINGIVLNSGESLKYSELVMPFTEENGYFPAPGYLQGKTVDMIGGGACQASSTLYAASIYANLEIVQRRNHGFASDYIGLGLDATVAEGGPEFEVRNNTDYPVKVEATFYTSSKKDYITVRLYGTKVDDTYVKIRTEQLSTTPFEEEIIETDELAPGVREVEQTAYTGYDVKTYRQIYSGDGTLLSETLEARSTYKARNRIVKVGKAAETVTAPVSDPTITEPAAQEVPEAVEITPEQQEIPAWLLW